MSRRGPVIQLDVERVLPARPATVFRALTEPALYARWMGPDGSTVTVDEMQPTEGGRLAFRVKVGEDGPEFGLHGTYREIDAPRRLVHTWAMEGDDSVSTVTFDLYPHDDGTRMVLTHVDLVDEAEREQNEGGWRHQLDRLERLLREVDDPTST
ncbi:MAG: SRPBCC domain-containing protein [Actinomycetota bacterium]|nr:SRPBCC domain-containing protein [Actinomycetota bacterium]